MEVTILLSNYIDDPVEASTKTITIKPLTYIQQTYEKPKQDEHNSSYEEQLHTSITAAEARLKEIEQEQKDLQLQTKEQIKQLRAGWEDERRQLVTEAKEEGYQAGFEIAKQEVKQQYQEKVNEANQLTRIAEEEHVKRIEQSTSSLIKLSVQIAQKIINKEIEENKQSFLSIVQAAIEEVKEQPEVQIHVPSAHYEFILLQKNELVELMNGQAIVSIYIAADDTCYITHPLGKIDISIDTQLTQMREQLIDLAMENQ